MVKLMIESVAEAYKEFKGFCLDEWEGDYREAAREALKAILEDRLTEVVRENGIGDRRNGYYCGHLLTELRHIELKIPRTRRFNPVGILRMFARRAGHVERMVLLAFVLGLSTRKVGEALLPVLGEVIYLSRLQIAYTIYH